MKAPSAITSKAVVVVLVKISFEGATTTAKETQEWVEIRLRFIAAQSSIRISHEPNLLYTHIKHN